MIQVEPPQASMTHPEARIERWWRGKSAALALTFDDWSPGHATVALPILDRARIPGTFFVPLNSFDMSPQFDHWGCFQEMVRRGHELGNHSRTHVDLSQLSCGRLYEEVEYPRQVMEEQLCNVSVESFSYPLGAWDERVVAEVARGHLGARAFDLNSREDVSFSYDFGKDGGYYRIPTVRMNAEISNEALQANLRGLVDQGGLMTCVFNGIYNEANPRDQVFFDAIDESQFVEFLQLLTQDSPVWLTTFGAAIRYHRLANASVCTVQSASPSHVVLELETTQDERLRDGEITITVAAAGLDSQCRDVIQDGQVLDFRQTPAGISFEATAKNSRLQVVLDS